MEIQTKTDHDITIIGINGNLDGNTAPVAQEKILPLLTTGGRFVFDMEKCDYISSAGLRLLLVVAKQLEKVSGSGAFATLTPEILDVMTMTGFDNIFMSYQTVDEAMKSLEKV
jgi:anti-anti-sigma factor